MPHPPSAILPEPGDSALFLIFYTTAVSGTNFFVPSLEVLKSFDT
jgi:hypothetical protein